MLSSVLAFPTSGSAFTAGTTAHRTSRNMLAASAPLFSRCRGHPCSPMSLVNIAANLIAVR